jgi:hypothetical protein
VSNQDPNVSAPLGPTVGTHRPVIPVVPSPPGPQPHTGSAPPPGPNPSPGANPPPGSTGVAGRQPVGPAPVAAGPGRRRFLPVLVSVGAVIIALAALVVAWRAFDRANDARDIALAGGRQPTAQQPAGTATVDNSAAGNSSGNTTSGNTTSGNSATTATPVDPNATGAPPLDQRTVFKVKYDKQTLTLKTQNSSSMEVDLDEPRANVQDGADITLHMNYSNNTPYFTLGQGAEGSEAGAPGMTPQDCADKIRRAPVGENVQIPVRQGNVLCIATSFAAAQAKGDVRRMVLLEVTGVATDGAVTVQLSAWDIPH